jgi:deoxycytidine triphosphate deaminase
MRILKKVIGGFLSACLEEHEQCTRTSILGRHIASHIKAGNLKISPYDPRRIKEGTIDLTAGPFYYLENPEYDEIGNLENPIHNPASPDSRQMWSPQHCTMLPLRDQCQREHIVYNAQQNIDPEQPVLLIPPGKSILLCSEEFISCSSKLELWVAGKSTMGRQRLSPLKDMTYCDPGFAGRVTFCIRNPFDYRHVVIARGWPIAQVSLRVGLDTGEHNYASRGKYHTAGKCFDDVIKNWTPDKMLPKMWKDFEKEEPVQAQPLAA